MLALAALEGLLAAEIGGRCRKLIDEYLEKCQPADLDQEPTISMEQLSDEVHFIRVERTHDPNVVKLVLGIKGWEGRKLLLDGLRAEGKAHHHVGPAPEGWLEEEIPIWLDPFRKTAA